MDMSFDSKRGNNEFLLKFILFFLIEFAAKILVVLV